MSGAPHHGALAGVRVLDLTWNHSLLGEGVTRTAELADMFRLSRSRDGWVVVVIGDDAMFRATCQAFGRPDLAEDPRYQTLLGRMQHIAELQAWTEGEIAQRGSDELCALLDQHGVPCAKVSDLAALVADPQVEHNGSLLELDHPVAGRLRQPRPPVDFSATPAAVRGPAPRLGEHTDEVLRELGISTAKATQRAGPLRRRRGSPID